MRYTKMERMAALVLSKFPGLKLAIKKMYQKLNYIKYKTDYTFISEYKIKCISLNEDESFFGYYDKSPLNLTNEYIIFQSTNSDTKKLPDNNSPVDLVLYNLRNETCEVIDNVTTYNWQQGSKLMWLNEKKIIYNNFDEESKEYISKIYDIERKEYTVIDMPIYDCYRDAYALSVNFDRLNLLRPDYGYRNKKNIIINWDNHVNDGIIFIDLKNNSHELLVTFEDSINVHHKDSMIGARHKFNHLSISPNGKKFMFLHRWFVEKRKFDRLMIADIDGSNLKCVSDDDMVSHCFWHGNSKIFSFLRDKTYGDKYYMVDIETSEKTVIGEGIIDNLGDGHPNIYGNDIIFDTYPNKARMKELYKFNLTTTSLEKIGEFFESFDFYGETRCDLHPRFSYDGKKVFIDSVHENKRHLYMIALEDKVG